MIGLESVISGENFVEVDIPIKDDIGPLGIREEWTPRESEYCQFRGSGVECIVVFKFECKFKSRVDGRTDAGWVVPRKE